MASYLASALLMAVLAALVGVAVVRNRRWESYSADSETRLPQSRDAAARPSTETPTGWIVGFVALVAVSVGGVYAFVTNPDAPAGLFSLPVLGVGGVLLVLYLLAGVYYAAKGRGHPSSIAAAESATVFGALFLLAAVSQLIV